MAGLMQAINIELPSDIDEADLSAIPVLLEAARKWRTAIGSRCSERGETRLSLNCSGCQCVQDGLSIPSNNREIGASGCVRLSAPLLPFLQGP